MGSRRSGKEIQLKTEQFSVHSHRFSTAPGDEHLLRRLDWRFLLPEPALRNVMYFGPGKDSLLRALKAHSGALQSATLPGRFRSLVRAERGFGAVVVQTPSIVVLRSARGLLAPDGWLYCELDRRATFKGALRSISRGTPRPGNPLAGLLRTPTFLLRALGYQDIRVHWHYPNFEACRWIVPLDGEAASAYFLARSDSSFLRAVAHRLGPWLIRTGMLPRAVPCVSVVARAQELSTGGVQ